MKNLAVLRLGFLVLFAPGIALAQFAEQANVQGGRYNPAQTQAPLPAESQGPLFGSVPSGAATAEVVPLTLADAIQRGLKYNMGIILGQENVRLTQAAVGRARSTLLPNITVASSMTGQQVNLEALGFGEFPAIPTTVIGPFGVFDVRAYLTQTVLDFTATNRVRAEKANQRAAEHSFRNVREQVIFLTSTLYLQAISGQSQIDSQRAQVETAQALHNLAVDRKNAGVAAGLDVLRAQVQLQAQQQRLIIAQNDFEKEKLALARAIGIPTGQQFTLADTIPYVPFQPPPFNQALDTAYMNREDYLSARERVRSAQYQKRAAEAERWPSLNFNGSYGDIGPRPWNSHGTFLVFANVRFPVFQGGRVRSDIAQADAMLRQQEAQVEEIRSRIYYELQSANLDLEAAGARAKIAAEARGLAEEQVREVQDRFAAGVATTVEVVQAQDALAIASNNYIASLYALNIARAALARAMAVPEDAFQQFLRGK